jgi:hypothetical protein
LAIIARFVPLAADEAGGTLAAARALANTSSEAGASFVGIISGASDVDMFRFSSGEGNVSVALTLASTAVGNRSPFPTWDRTNLQAEVPGMAYGAGMHASLHLYASSWHTHFLGASTRTRAPARVLRRT